MLREHGGFVEMLDVTPMTRSYKMQVLLGMLNAGRFPGRIAVADLAKEVRKLASRTVRAGADLGPALEDPQALIQLLEKNPIDAWTGGRGTRDVIYFEYSDGEFRTKFDVRPELVPAFQEIVRELAEWRLAE